MKRILALILAMLLAFGAVACSSGNDDEPTGKETGSTQGGNDGKGEKGNGGDDGEDEKGKGKPETKEFALNPEYIGYIGMTKGEIDDLCGNKGEYNAEFGVVDYGNGLQIGYNTLGIMDLPADDEVASTMFITLDKLFLNCPNTVTKEQIKSVFSDCYESYSEMDEEDTILANCNGKCLIIYPDSGLGKNTSAFLTSDAFVPQGGTGAAANGNILGLYGTNDWVEGSYVQIRQDGPNYLVDIYLVRGAFILDAVGKMESDTKMSVTSPDYSEDIILTWTKDYQHMAVQCSDDNWKNFVSASKINFYKE